MTDGVLIALITTIGGGILTLLGMWVKSVSDRASKLAEEGEEARKGLREDLEALRVEIKDLKAENATLRTERDTSRYRILDLESGQRRLERENSALKQEVETLQKDNRQLQSKIDEQDLVMADLRTQISLMQDREAKRDG